MGDETLPKKKSSSENLGRGTRVALTTRIDGTEKRKQIPLENVPILPEIGAAPDKDTQDIPLLDILAKLNKPR